jgi:hypothetical protein
MSKHWPLVFFLLSFNAYAEPCKIEMKDLTESIMLVGQQQVLTLSGLTDPYSKETIRRYIQQLQDGSIIVVEQKHCLIYNLTVTVLLPEGVPIDVASKRLGSTLKKTPEWNQFFNDLNAEKILHSEFASKRFKSLVNRMGSYSYSMDDRITSKHENSEVTLNLVKLDSGTLPFNVIVSLYIGVGGL